MSPKVTDLDRRIAKRLQELRRERKLTQPAVAGVLKITYQSYQKMEAGRVSFRASTLETLAAVFGVPVATLIGNGKIERLPNCDKISSMVLVMADMSEAQAGDVLSHAMQVRGKAA